MFDWSDLLLLLPNKAFWSLFTILSLLVVALALWLKCARRKWQLSTLFSRFHTQRARCDA
jgi:hypothetical protein